MHHVNRLGAAVLALAALLSTASAPSFAATAHNSQAGALGPTTNNEGPTAASPKTRHHRRHKKM